MKALEAFDINLREKELVCLIGGGGKTTTMFKLAKELKSQGKKVLVTTTTAIYKPEKSEYDSLVLYDNNESLRVYNQATKGAITVLGKTISPSNKLMGVDCNLINNLFKKDVFDFIFVEGDGSRNMPIKAPASHEPVIPESATKVIGVVGMDALYQKINKENVHRPELFCEVTQTKLDDLIDEESVARLVVSDKGLFKSTNRDCRRYLFLNKIEGEKRRKYGYKITDILSTKKHSINSIILGSNIKSNYNVLRC